MKTKIEANADVGSSEVSLIRGGPFYHILQALRLIHPDRWEFFTVRSHSLSLLVGCHYSSIYIDTYQCYERTLAHLETRSKSPSGIYSFG
jgi:hypothetical protein